MIRTFFCASANMKKIKPDKTQSGSHTWDLFDRIIWIYQ